MIRLWRRYQRWCDTWMLWPVCKAQCDYNRLTAEHAFRVHTLLDPAYRDLTEDEVWEFIKRLP